MSKSNSGNMPSGQGGSQNSGMITTQTSTITVPFSTSSTSSTGQSSVTTSTQTTTTTSTSTSSSAQTKYEVALFSGYNFTNDIFPADRREFAMKLMLQNPITQKTKDSIVGFLKLEKDKNRTDYKKNHEQFWNIKNPIIQLETKTAEKTNLETEKEKLEVMRSDGSGDSNSLTDAKTHISSAYIWRKVLEDMIVSV